MASFAKHFSLLFLVILLSSLHIHGRESKFFNKVPSNNNNAKETEVPTKEEPLSKQEQEPSFIPQTENGYGLYGHETGQLPPTTTTTPTTGVPYKATTYFPYKTEFEEPFNKVNPNEAYVTEPQGMTDTRFMDKGYTTTNTNNNNNYYNGQKQGMSDTRFMDKGYTTTNTNNNNNYYNGQQQGMSDTRFMDKGYATTNNNKYYYNGQKQAGMSDTRFMDKGYTTTTNSNNYNNGGNMYSTQKQGMSDTRFLENGRYYYDLNNEKYNRKGTNYGNNENSYEYNNSMEGYQNQEEFQDEYMP